jgi:hypothetical protein
MNAVKKVLCEMSRPVFSLLDRGPLSECGRLEHLAHTNDSIIIEYEGEAEAYGRSRGIFLLPTGCLQCLGAVFIPINIRNKHAHLSKMEHLFR